VSGSSTGNQAGTYGTLGIPDPANVPGAREGSVAARDVSGNLFVFGGAGIDSAGAYGYLNDFWKWNVATSRWSWVNGSNVVNQPGIYGTKGETSPTSIPGARGWAGSDVDASGRLWLFGGWGYDSAGNTPHLNDQL
jgi:hypothetical protein